MPSAGPSTPKPYYPTPKDAFNNWDYLRHNQRRQEHLASLGLDLAGASVLEVGAGIGDHTHFFLDRGCRVVSTEGRPENLALLKERYPKIETRLLDLERPTLEFPSPFDVIYCYGTLYHLSNPAQALAYLARYCGRLLLLETCVSFTQPETINLCAEPAIEFSQAVSGCGCRPGRRWVFNELKQHFRFVYLPITQPCHEEFPIDWTAPKAPAPLTRSVFIASRQELRNPLLLESVPDRQQYR